MIYGKIKASITIFISVLMIIVLAFTSAICEAVRIRGARISATCAFDAAVESAFAKYDELLLKKFGIFGSYYEGMESFLDSVSEDIERNLNPEKEFLLLSDSDFWKVKVKNISFNQYQLITDNNGEAFFDQAISYVKDNAPMGILELLMEYANGNDSPEEIEKYFAEEEQENDELIEAYTEEANSKENTSEENTYEYTGEIIEVEKSPADVVKEIKKNGIFSLVVPQGKSLSGNSINPDSCLSIRELKQGIVSIPSESDLFEKALFIEYISQKLSDFTTSDGNSKYLNYKLEYCVGGKSCDEDNLKYVVNRLLLIKEAANFTYLLTDSVKVSQALAVAAGLVGATGIQPLVEAVKYAILLAWAYAESIVDVRNILNGGTSSLIKTSENWRLSIENIGIIGEVLKEPVKENYGLEYTEYLKLMLMFMQKDDIVLKSMDMVEHAMKEEYQRDSYCMDNLVVYAEPVALFSSSPIFLNFKFTNRYRYNTEFNVKTKYSYI